MDAQNQTSGDETTSTLIEKLKAVRRSSTGRPEAEVMDALRRALQEELLGLSEAAAERAVDRARGLLVDEARQREERLLSLDAEVKRRGAEIEALRAERDRLLEERRRPQVGPGSSAAGAASPGGLEWLREALRKVTLGQEVSPESLGLPEAEGRLFRLAGELLGFALKSETVVHDLLQSIEIGFAQDTRQSKRQKTIIEDRFRACLDNKEGSVQALKDGLNRNLRFLLKLNEAYMASVRQGVTALLSDLDPQPFEEASRGVLGLNFEKAWKAFSDRWADLSSAPAQDIWGRFFDAPFKQKLEGYLEPGAARG